MSTNSPVQRLEKVKRVCILTGGGDAPGLNAVLRAFVLTATDLGIEVFGSEDGFEGLVQPDRLIPMNRDSVRGILPRGGSILGCSNRANPFAYTQKGPDGKNTYENVSEQVIKRLKENQIDALVLVGGDGTMNHAMRFLSLGVPVIGVPKTIDNDLGATDQTFGFDTAVNTASWAIDTLHSTAESHDRVMIVELMGRYAGWISLYAGIAGGADAILIPEMPYDIDRVIAKINRRSNKGLTFSMIVVGEGAYPVGGSLATAEPGVVGHLPRLAGAGQTVAKLLENRVPHEVRVTVLGHLQRGGSPSAYDRLLGSRFGVKAAKLVSEGRVGVMVALKGMDIVEVPITEAVNKPHLVTPQDELIEVARCLNIELGA